MKKPKKPLTPLQELFRRSPSESSSETVLSQETEIAIMVDGRRHSGSGASMFSKSDGSSVRYQIEAKQTKNASLSIKLEWLNKICLEAMGRGRIPLLALRFLFGVRAGLDKDWILIPRSEFEFLYKAAKGDKLALPRWEEDGE